MASFLFAFVAVVLVSLGSRDQLLMARLGVVLGRRGALLTAGMFAAIASASLMAWAGEAVAHLLPEPAQGMLVAIALLLAAAELAWPNRERLPQEPTRSFFAIFVVLLARQLGDGARFLLFALSAATVSPVLVAAGGSLGGMAAVGIVWGGGESIDRHLPLRVIRLVLATVLLAVAAVLALNARGTVG